MIRKFLSRNRMRKARKRVSKEPSPSNYAAPVSYTHLTLPTKA